MKPMPRKPFIHHIFQEPEVIVLEQVVVSPRDINRCVCKAQVGTGLLYAFCRTVWVLPRCTLFLGDMGREEVLALLPVRVARQPSGFARPRGDGTVGFASLVPSLQSSQRILPMAFS